MNFTCDVCGREVFSCTFVNGMKFCAKCYQETFGETDKDRKISDLEAKLAESEKQCQECKHLNKKIELNIKNKLMAENCELQKQLAEKEKEISEYIKIVDDLHKQLSDKCDFCDKTKDQDKISFAVEQLEKVREFCEKELKECDKLLKTEFEDDFYIQSVMARESMCFDFRRTIDSQIKQLKGKK